MPDQATPRDVYAKLNSDDRRMQASLRELQKARSEGVDEGRSRARKEFLDYLESRYLRADISRNSVEGQAILKLTKEVTAFFSGRAQ